MRIISRRMNKFCDSLLHTIIIDSGTVSHPVIGSGPLEAGMCKSGHLHNGTSKQQDLGYYLNTQETCTETIQS